jgi:hypothetical protein
MILFAVADSRVSPTFSVLGITLVSLSVVADAFLPNVQVRSAVLHPSVHAQSPFVPACECDSGGTALAIPRAGW